MEYYIDPIEKGNQSREHNRSRVGIQTCQQGEWKEMKLLYGTANPAKLQSMKEMLRGLDMEIIGLREMPIAFDEVEESGSSPLENAVLKARSYYSQAGIPVFSCDSGLYIDGVEDSRQPGVHVRRVGGRVLDDDQMIEYYSGLALEYGGKLTARYRNAIAFMLDESTLFTYDGDDICTAPFEMTSVVHERRNAGFPLDSISVEPATGRYFIEIGPDDESSEDTIAPGFRHFFQRAIPSE